MTAFDLHTHTSFSDGEASPEEMACAALARGMTCLGFSDHSYTSFDLPPCVPKERLEERRRVLASLKEKYRGRIGLFCGIEQEYYSDIPAEGYDYVIGSVHYLLLDGEYRHVDNTPEMARKAVETQFCGDWYAYAAAYFDTVADVVDRTGCGIIGHFDLVSKFNEKGRFFDETHPRYVAAWKAAADALLPTGALFEINTGAIARGWRTVPYPAPPILEYLISRGARFLLSSDAHAPEGLCCGFERWGAWAAARGAVLAESPDFCIH